jgi:hypothetical protein
LGFPSLVAVINSQTSNPASIEYLEGLDSRPAVSRSFDPSSQAVAQHVGPRTPMS